MKLLKDKVNSSADGTYPLGKIRDDSGDGISGSQVNAEFMNDYVQCMEKIFAESGLTANGYPDNDANGYELFEGFKTFFRKYLRPYNTYHAQIKAEYGANPVAVKVYINEIVGSITLTRAAFGNWNILIPNCLVAKVSFSWTPIDYNNAGYSVITDVFQSGSNVQCSFLTNNFGGANIDRLNGIIEVRIYD